MAAPTLTPRTVRTCEQGMARDVHRCYPACLVIVAGNLGLTFCAYTCLLPGDASGEGEGSDGEGRRRRRRRRRVVRPPSPGALPASGWLAQELPSDDEEDEDFAAVADEEEEEDEEEGGEEGVGCRRALNLLVEMAASRLVADICTALHVVV